MVGLCGENHGSPFLFVFTVMSSSSWFWGQRQCVFFSHRTWDCHSKSWFHLLSTLLQDFVFTLVEHNLWVEEFYCTQPIHFQFHLKSRLLTLLLLRRCVNIMQSCLAQKGKVGNWQKGINSDSAQSLHSQGESLHQHHHKDNNVLAGKRLLLVSSKAIVTKVLIAPRWQGNKTGTALLLFFRHPCTVGRFCWEIIFHHQENAFELRFSPSHEQGQISHGVVKKSVFFQAELGHDWLFSCATGWPFFNTFDHQPWHGISLITSHHASKKIQVVKVTRAIFDTAHQNMLLLPICWCCRCVQLTMP